MFTTTHETASYEICTRSSVGTETQKKNSGWFSSGSLRSKSFGLGFGRKIKRKNDDRTDADEIGVVTVVVKPSSESPILSADFGLPTSPTSKETLRARSHSNLGSNYSFGGLRKRLASDPYLNRPEKERELPSSSPSLSEIGLPVTIEEKRKKKHSFGALAKRKHVSQSSSSSFIVSEKGLKIPEASLMPQSRPMSADAIMRIDNTAVLDPFAPTPVLAVLAKKSEREEVMLSRIADIGEKDQHGKLRPSWPLERTIPDIQDNPQLYTLITGREPPVRPYGSWTPLPSSPSVSSPTHDVPTSPTASSISGALPSTPRRKKNSITSVNQTLSPSSSSSNVKKVISYPTLIGSTVGFDENTGSSASANDEWGVRTRPFVNPASRVSEGDTVRFPVAAEDTITIPNPKAKRVPTPLPTVPKRDLQDLTNEGGKGIWPGPTTIFPPTCLKRPNDFLQSVHTRRREKDDSNSPCTSASSTLVSDKQPFLGIQLGSHFSWSHSTATLESQSSLPRQSIESDGVKEAIEIESIIEWNFEKSFFELEKEELEAHERERTRSEDISVDSFTNVSILERTLIEIDSSAFDHVYKHINDSITPTATNFPAAPPAITTSPVALETATRKRLSSVHDKNVARRSPLSHFSLFGKSISRNIRKDLSMGSSPVLPAIEQDFPSTRFSGLMRAQSQHHRKKSFDTGVKTKLTRKSISNVATLKKEETPKERISSPMASWTQNQTDDDISFSEYASDIDDSALLATRPLNINSPASTRSVTRTTSELLLHRNRASAYTHTHDRLDSDTQWSLSLTTESTFDEDEDTFANTHLEKPTTPSSALYSDTSLGEFDNSYRDCDGLSIGTIHKEDPLMDHTPGPSTPSLTVREGWKLVSKAQRSSV